MPSPLDRRSRLFCRELRSRLARLLRSRRLRPGALHRNVSCLHLHHLHDLASLPLPGAWRGEEGEGTSEEAGELGRKSSLRGAADLGDAGDDLMLRLAALRHLLVPAHAASRAARTRPFQERQDHVDFELGPLFGLGCQLPGASRAFRHSVARAAARRGGDERDELPRPCPIPGVRVISSEF